MTEIVTCILLTSNQMIFLMQFGINKHSYIFQRLQIALALRARAIFGSLRKIYLCLFIPNCTRNHLITYTNILFYYINTSEIQCLTRSLRSLERYRVEHSKIKFISTSEHVISSQGVSSSWLVISKTEY